MQNIRCIYHFTRYFRKLYVIGILLLPQMVQAQKLGTFSCTGGVQNYTVPAGVCQIKIKAWGGGSGGGGVDAYVGGNGSGGSYAEVTVNVSAGDVLNVYTGCKGTGGTGCGANFQGGIGGWGYGRGGNGGASGPVPCSGSGGGGGGSSAVLLNGTLLVAAAGGGGGGGAGCTSPGGTGGAGGNNGGASSCTGGGSAASNGNFHGATGSTHPADGGGGGGGGGGAFNGGQGGLSSPSGNSCNPANDCGAGGGAGGNSYAPGGVITNGSGQNPGNAGDPDLCGSCSRGGGSQAAGTDGFIVFYQIASSMSGIMNHTDVSCNGGNDGSAGISVSGGTLPYTYTWNTNETNQQALNLSSGTYKVTVTDANKCKLQDSIFIDEALPLSYSLTTNAVSCYGGNDGSANITVAGGTPGYSYIWNSNPAQLDSVLTQVSSGNYTVDVTDSKGCTLQVDTLISEPSALQVSSSKINVSCYQGSNGNSTLNPSGGTMPYSYTWNTTPVQTTKNANGLKAGDYDYTVSDNKGCIVKGQIQITEPSLLTSTISASKNVSCNGGNDGTASVSVSGGTSAYLYLWNTSPLQNSATAVGLKAGTYTVTVTDSKLCTSISNVTITEPMALNSTLSGVDVKCNKGNDGTATALVGGGTPPYSYSWNTVPVQTTAQANSLAALSYEVRVTDSLQCVIVDSVQINEPGDMQISGIVKDASCNGMNDGSIAITVTGGIPVYQYMWSTNPLETTDKLNAIKTGIYTVWVTDQNLCTDSSVFTVKEPATLSVTHTQEDVSCSGGTNGNASLIVNGGTLPYTYVWNTNPVQTLVTAVNLKEGIYTVLVTDKLGCTSNHNILIKEPDALKISIENIKHVNCFAGTDGSAEIYASGGIPQYTYNWSTIPAQNDTMAVLLNAGSYSVTVTDANMCKKDTSITINEPKVLNATVNSVKHVSCHSYADGAISVTQTGGTFPYSYVWSNSETNSAIDSLYAGMYQISIIDSNACVDTLIIAIHEPDELTTSIADIKNASCKSSADGQAVVLPSGGTPQYTYSWNTNPVQSNDTVQGLKAGVYEVTVMDANLCSDTNYLVITEPDSLEINASGDANICIGQSSTLAAVASGGTAGYTYIWSNGGTSSVIQVSPVVTTDFYVYAVDTNLCVSATDTVEIIVRSELDVFTTSVNPICEGESTSLFASAQGGDGNFTYTWRPVNASGSGPVQVSPSITTTYTVTVTDGCNTPADSASINVQVNPLPDINFIGDTLKGCMPHEVNFTDLSNILAPSQLGNRYWNFGDIGSNDNTSTQQNPSHVYEQAGVYSVSLVVSSLEGCVDSTLMNAYISVYPPPVSNFTASNDTVLIIRPVFEFTETANGESTYLWDFGDGQTSMDENPVHIYNEEGNYEVCLTVTSAFGCEDSYCQKVYVAPDYTFYVPNAFTPDNDGINDTFGGAGIGIKEYNLYIFDRWGNLIFTSNDLYTRWDGKANGGINIAQMDVYLYLIEVKDIFGKIHEYQGRVTLLK